MWVVYLFKMKVCPKNVTKITKVTKVIVHKVNVNKVIERML